MDFQSRTNVAVITTAKTFESDGYLSFIMQNTGTETAILFNEFEIPPGASLTVGETQLSYPRWDRIPVTFTSTGGTARLIILVDQKTANR